MDNTQTWSTKGQSEALKKLTEELEMSMFWGLKKELTSEERYNNDIKLAYVIQNGERKMVGLNRTDNKAYELREDVPTWKIPLVQTEYDSFERWCRSMDL